MYALKDFLHFPFASFAVNGDFQHNGLGDRIVRSLVQYPFGKYSRVVVKQTNGSKWWNRVLPCL